MTNFPFYAIGKLTFDNKKVEYDRNSFIANYKSIVPSKEYIEKIKYNQEVTDKEEAYTYKLNLFRDDNKDFILNVSCDLYELGMTYSQYTFSKINDEYKLKQLVLRN